MRIVIAPDKFKGTATAAEVAGAAGDAVAAAGHEATLVPMADGGDGTLDALGGPNRHSTVTGPLGDPVDAPWRLTRSGAVIEMATCSGLVLAGGPEGNDPLGASTRGTGELIGVAISRGAKRIIVGLGGSATTDGGLGAVEAIGSQARLAGVDLIAATDVTTRFEEAAAVFGPQKGASPAQVKLLGRRLQQLAARYRDEFGIDVTELVGSGAAGGLAGGLAALGASIVGGFDLIAEEVGLGDAIESANLVITGEGRLDTESFAGKVVGGVSEMAADAGARLVVIAGSVDQAALAAVPEATVVSLERRFGSETALADPVGSVRTAVAEVLADLPVT